VFGMRMIQIHALGDNERGLELLHEAVAIDSAFAMAWRRIASAYTSPGRGCAAQMAAIERAYRLRERLSDNERLVTEAGYYSFGPNPDIDRTLAAYEALLERDSLSTPALNNGGIRYLYKGDYSRAEALFRRAASVAAPFGGVFANLAMSQTALGKIAAAESSAAAFERALPSNSAHWLPRQMVLVAKGDYAGAEQRARDAFANPKLASQTGGVPRGGARRPRANRRQDREPLR
jgi:tetratricopeptide (TPR) repeat protein